MKRNWIILTMLLISITASGCVTAKKMNNVEELVEHPQFPSAAREAPAWTKAALKKVAELEYQLERK